MDTLWLKLDKEILEKTLPKAQEDHFSCYGDRTGYLWEQLQVISLEDTTSEYEDGFVKCNFTILDPNEGEIGLGLLEVKISDDVAILIIQEYIKKMNKVKTVLEATK